MDAAQQEARNKQTPPESDPTKIDPQHLRAVKAL
jgi:hypothetical protein